MQLLIALAFIAFLIAADLTGHDAVGSVALKVTWIAILSSTIPVVATITVVSVIRKTRRFEQRLVSDRDIEFTNFWLVGLWAIVCFFEISVLDWSNIVRANWQLDRYPPLSQIVFLFPLILPLLLCWIAMFELENYGAHDARQSTVRVLWQSRLHFVVLRIRLYLSLAILPLLLVWTAKDVSFLLSTPTNRQSVQLIAYIIAFSAMLALAPWMLAMIWNARSIAPGELSERLKSLCRREGVFVGSIRVWNTRNQVANALVAGVIPKTRMMMLTDRLLKLLDLAELETVVRHEIGHIRYRHLMMRTFFLLLPILLYMVILVLRPEVMESGLNQVARFGISSTWLSVVLIPTIYLGYLVAMMRWLSRKMEFEADLYACHLSGNHVRFQLDSNANDHFARALIKLAADSDQPVDQKSWLHPSIRERVLFLDRVRQCPAVADVYLREFRERKWQIVAGFGLLTIVVLTVF